MDEFIRLFSIVVLIVSLSVATVGIVTLLENSGTLNVFKKKYLYLSSDRTEYKIYLSRNSDLAVIKGDGVKKVIYAPKEEEILKRIDEIESLKTSLEVYTIRAKEKSN